MLSRDEILRRDDRQRKTVTVPAWGGAVTVRELSMADKAAVLTVMAGEDGDGKSQAQRAVAANAMMIVRAVIDAAGAAVFADGDLPAIEAMPESVVMPVMDAIRSLGETPAAKDLEKN